MGEKIKVAVLGATGSVGQRMIALLQEHPWFEISELGASSSSAGKKYGERVKWFQESLPNESIADLRIKACNPDEIESGVIFSALDAGPATEIEAEFAKRGRVVISNARSHRMRSDVPLLVPEINADHLELISLQQTEGFIVTNPNCSTIGLVMALKPLEDAYGVRRVSVVTMQALSGAGYPGVSSLDIMDNVIPFIGGEEDKIETEPRKILGTVSKEGVKFHSMHISAQCNRVPVLDGHLLSVQVELKQKTTPEDMIRAWKEYEAEPQRLKLPSAPSSPIVYFDQEDYPQPRLHRNLGNGMAISIGRLRRDTILDYKFVTLSHNTIRGAAGGTILCAELLKAKGYIK